MSASDNRHGVKATSIDGELSSVTWRHRRDTCKLERVQEGWILVVGKACYQLTMPGHPDTAVFKDSTGEYMATRVEPNRHYDTVENAVVIVEGDGKIVLDSEVLETKDMRITKDGKDYGEGDIITVAGRRARIAVGQST